MLVICPSRGRPQNIEALLECWATTDAKADLVVCVDNDDPLLDDYQQVPTVQLVVGPRKSLGGWINTIAVGANADIIGVIGDDVRPRTWMWDAEIQTVMTPLGIVYGNDLHQSEALPTHPFVDAEIVRRLGYLAPPGIEHLYLDNFWKALGEGLGTLTYCADVILEHMHPHAGKAEMDDGYKIVNSRAAYKAGRRAFESYMLHRFDADLARCA